MSALVIQPWQIWVPPREIVRPKLRPMLSVIGRALGFMAGGNSYATWNPSDCSANITLSGGNLITAIGTSGLGFVRSTIGKSAGKHYWESTGNSGSKYWYGIATITDANTGTIGATANGFSYYSAGGQYFSSGGYTAYGASYAAGDVIGIALDMSGPTVTFYKNNASQGAITIAAGTWYAARGQSADGTGHQMTTNFGASALTYTPPSGHNAGLYN